MKKARSYWVALFLFIPLYHFTKSPLLASDAEGWIQRATNPSTSEFHYGATGHFLQMPLSHHLHLIAQAVGLDFSVRQIFLAICFWSAIGSLFFFYFFLQHWFRFHDKAKEKDWIPLAGTVLYGTSFAPWVYWNGELFALSLLSIFGSLYFLSKKRFVVAGLSWAVAVLAHSEFSLLAPAFAFFLFLENRRQQDDRWFFPYIKQSFSFFAFSGCATAIILVAGGYLLHKWHDPTSLFQWFQADLAKRTFWLGSGLQPLKAMKGLITSVTVAGHYLGEFLKGWRPHQYWELFSLIWSLAQVALVFLLSALSMFRWRVFLFSLLWILPLQLLLNWRFLPAVEEYHSASQPALSFMLLAGALVAADRMNSKKILIAIYVFQFFFLNLFLGILPLKNFGDRVLLASEWFERNPQAAVLVCDAQTFLEKSRIETFRIKGMAREGNPNLIEIQSAILSWVDSKISEGKEVYTLGNRCEAEYWSTERVSIGLPTLAKDITHMNFSFLEKKYFIETANLNSLPLNAVVATNPITWKTETLYKIKPFRAQ